MLLLEHRPGHAWGPSLLALAQLAVLLGPEPVPQPLLLLLVQLALRHRGRSLQALVAACPAAERSAVQPLPTGSAAAAAAAAAVEHASVHHPPTTLCHHRLLLLLLLLLLVVRLLALCLLPLRAPEPVAHVSL